MLRLREHLLRARERRWLRLALLCALAVLLVLTVGHVTHDAAEHEALAAACVAIVFLASFGPRRRRPATAIPTVRFSPRAAPQPRLFSPPRPLVFTPLRR